MSCISANQTLPSKRGKEKAPGGTTKARNDAKWERFHAEVYQIYWLDDKTLDETRMIIKEKYEFEACERKWKDKLDEWGYKKYISASDMTILAQKADRRVRKEGKATEFKHLGRKIDGERIEKFKKRKLKNEQDELGEGEEFATPENFTYHTPHSGLIQHDNLLIEMNPGGAEASFPYPSMLNFKLDLITEVAVDYEKIIKKRICALSRHEPSCARDFTNDLVSHTAWLKVLTQIAADINTTTSELSSYLLVLFQTPHLWHRSSDKALIFSGQHQCKTLLNRTQIVLGVHDSATNILRCRYACLLADWGDYNEATRQYEQVITTMETQLDSEGYLTSLRCKIALFSLHLEHGKEKAYSQLEFLRRFVNASDKCKTRKTDSKWDKVIFLWPEVTGLLYFRRLDRMIDSRAIWAIVRLYNYFIESDQMSISWATLDRMINELRHVAILASAPCPVIMDRSEDRVFNSGVSSNKGRWDDLPSVGLSGDGVQDDDNKSKYGITYSCSTITSVSDSVYMVP